MDPHCSGGLLSVKLPFREQDHTMARERIQSKDSEGRSEGGPSEVDDHVWANFPEQYWLQGAEFPRCGWRY